MNLVVIYPWNYILWRCGICSIVSLLSWQVEKRMVLSAEAVRVEDLLVRNQRRNLSEGNSLM